MDYKTFRQLFVTRSGRYDLINTDYTDNGADFFINAGQRMLDRILDHNKLLARSYHAVVAGEWYKYTVGLEAIKEVWVTDANGEKSRLVKSVISQLRNLYYEPVANLSQGVPYYYAPGVFRPYPDTMTAATLASFQDKDDVIAYNEPGVGISHFTYNGIIFMPPADASYTLSIWGKFRSPELSATESGGSWTQTTSFWLELHDDILLKAALYELETFYRNTEGAKDWMAIIERDITSMDSMIADEEQSDVEEMAG